MSSCHSLILLNTDHIVAMILFMCLLHLPGQDDNTVNGFIVLIPTPANGHIESDARSDDWNSY